MVALIEPEFDELAGRTLVVLGAGTIGRGVMAIGEAFGMRVIGLTSQSSVVELVQAMAEHVRAYAAERGKGGG